MPALARPWIARLLALSLLAVPLAAGADDATPPPDQSDKAPPAKPDNEAPPAEAPAPPPAPETPPPPPAPAKKKGKKKPKPAEPEGAKTCTGPNCQGNP